MLSTLVLPTDPVKLHSLTFSSRKQLDAVLSDISSSRPGDVITLKEPPLAANLLLPSTFDSKTTPSQKRAAQLAILKHHSLSNDDIIIPLPVMRGRTKLHAHPVHSPSGIGKAHTKDVFPCELPLQ